MSLVKSARSKHWMPKDQWIVVVTRAGSNKYFYGETRKEAIKAGGIKPHEVFTARRFVGGPKTVCALTERETVLEY